MRRAALLLLLALSAACFAKDGGGRGPALGSVASPTRMGETGGGGAVSVGVGGSTMRYGPRDLRPVPPLDPSRVVNEQDCTKPLDLAAGNLRCR